MEEQLVTFETAKLAKEKGFQENTSSYYFEDGEFRKNKLTGTNGYYGEDYCFELEEFLENWNSKWVTRKNGDRCFGCNKFKGYFDTYSAPTQSLLQKWLREIHEIHISIVFDKNTINTVYFFILDSGDGYLHKESLRQFKNYEKALESGLFEALKLI